MSEDILHRMCISSRNPDLEMTEEMHNQALLLNDDMDYLKCGSLLVMLGMPVPDRGMNDAFNQTWNGNVNRIDKNYTNQFK